MTQQPAPPPYAWGASQGHSPRTMPSICIPPRASGGLPSRTPSTPLAEVNTGGTTVLLNLESHRNLAVVRLTVEFCKRVCKRARVTTVTDPIEEMPAKHLGLEAIRNKAGLYWLRHQSSWH